jgi:hypothetical protein
MSVYRAPYPDVERALVEAPRQRSYGKAGAIASVGAHVALLVAAFAFSSRTPNLPDDTTEVVQVLVGNVSVAPLGGCCSWCATTDGACDPASPGPGFHATAVRFARVKRR